MPVGWTLADEYRPSTKPDVQAMQLRIDTLEAQLEAMTMQSGAPTGTNTPAGGQAAPLLPCVDVYGVSSLRIVAYAEAHTFGRIPGRSRVRLLSLKRETRGGADLL